MISILDLPHNIEEYLTVPIILEDGLPCIPSGGDMVYCPRVLNPRVG